MMTDFQLMKEVLNTVTFRGLRPLIPNQCVDPLNPCRFFTTLAF